MGRHPLSAQEWFDKQDEVVVIGISDGVIDIKTPVSLEETFGMVAIAYDMLLAAVSKERGSTSLQ